MNDNDKNINLKIDINDFNSSVSELLKRVKEDTLNVEQASIIEIIDQYLKYVIQRKNTIDLSSSGRTINEIATMLKIKSESLLPKLEVNSSEEADDEDNDFESSKEKEAYLQEYDRYQKIVKYLKEREGTQNDIYFPTAENDVQEDGIEIEKVDLSDLLASLDKVLQSKKKEEFIPFKIRSFTVETKMKDIAHLLKGNKEGLSFDYFMEKAQSKLEIIITFLALLELIFLQKIKCYQNKSFDKIIFNLKEGALNLKKN